MATRINNIKQLKPGDTIWYIDKFTRNADFIEFVCIHPHNPEYSIFLDSCYDGMPKFYNKKLENEQFFLYDASDVCWEEIHLAELTETKKHEEYLEKRLQEVRDGKNT